MGALHSGVRTRRAGEGNDGNVTAGLFHRDLRGARWKTEEMQRAICSPWHTPNLPERLERNIQQKIKKKNIKQQQRENKLVFLFFYFAIWCGCMRKKKGAFESSLNEPVQTEESMIAGDVSIKSKILLMLSWLCNICCYSGWLNVLVCVRGMLIISFNAFT